MCYTISTSVQLETLKERFESSLTDDETITPHYYLNGFNHPKTPVISAAKPNAIGNYYWGLISAFCKTVKDAKEMMPKTLNAKCETVFALPSFRNSMKQKRCLVLVDGFYEWRTLGKQKYPYFIRTTNKQPFALGGIYNDWVNTETGEIIHSFSIITTAANPLMEKIHNMKLRMPFIVPKENEKDWLNQSLSESEINHLMKPFDENQMEAYTISKLITNKNENPDKPEIQHPFEYPELAMFDL